MSEASGREGERGVCVCEGGSIIGVTQPQVQHLRLGMLRYVYYFVLGMAIILSIIF